MKIHKSSIISLFCGFSKKISYFEKNGTLKGYDSNQPSIASIEQSAFGESAPADQSTLDEIERKKQLRSKRAGL